MKSLRTSFVILAFVISAGAAFAKNAYSVTTLEVWEWNGFDCRAVLCVITGYYPCADAGQSNFTYYTNVACIGDPIIPKEPKPWL